MPCMSPCVAGCADGGARRVHGDGRCMIGEVVRGPVAAGSGRWYPAKVLCMPKTFVRVGVSGGTRWKSGMSTLQTRWGAMGTADNVS